MIRLKGTSKTLEVVLGEAAITQELSVVTSFGIVAFQGSDRADLVDMDDAGVLTTGTTAVTIAGSADTAAKTVGVEQISIYNRDTIAHLVTVQLNDGTNTYPIRAVTLQPGDAMLYDNGWTVEKKNNVAATGNIFTVPLGAGEEQVGQWERVDETWVGSRTFTDVPGRLFYEFSDNLVNINTFPPEGYPLRAGLTEYHTAEKLGAYYRSRIVNGSESQGALAHYPWYGAYDQGITPLNVAASPANDAALTRPTDFDDEVIIDRRNGVIHISKFGYRDDIDIADGDALIIGDDTTNAPEILAAPETYDIAYTAANDGDGTSGALVLQFSHINELGEWETVEHTLGNTGTDTTSFSGYGINRCQVVSVGASLGPNNSNISDITITSTTTGGVQAFIPAGVGVTQQLVLFIPFNATAVIRSATFKGLRIAAGTEPILSFQGWLLLRDGGATSQVYRADLDTEVNNIVPQEEIGQKVPAGSVFWATCGTTIDNSSAQGRFNVTIYETGFTALAPVNPVGAVAIGQRAIGESGIGA